MTRLDVSHPSFQSSSQRVSQGGNPALKSALQMVPEIPAYRNPPPCPSPHSPTAEDFLPATSGLRTGLRTAFRWGGVSISAQEGFRGGSPPGREVEGLIWKRLQSSTLGLGLFIWAWEGWRLSGAKAPQPPAPGCQGEECHSCCVLWEGLPGSRTDEVRQAPLPRLLGKREAGERVWTKLPPRGGKGISTEERDPRRENEERKEAESEQQGGKTQV